MRGRKQKFDSEADLVAAFCSYIERVNHVRQKDPDHPERWTIYPETADFDLLIVQDCTGVQIGIEAKLTFNLKVIEQALPRLFDDSFFGDKPSIGPDYRAVLVPSGGSQKSLPRITHLLGITVIHVYNQRYDPSDDREWKPWDGWVPPPKEWAITPRLPIETDDSFYQSKEWMNWNPEERCPLPDYVPDVAAGIASPIKLTPWKIKAIKLLIVLNRRGYVTRADMRALKISASYWTAGWGRALSPGKKRGEWVAYDMTPDIKSQHPKIWKEIESDIDNWIGDIELD